MRAVAVLLAAEEGRGLGHPPALVEHEGGRSFLRSLALNFSRAGAQPLGVIGADAEGVRAQHPELLLVEDPDWQKGGLSALRVGLGAALQEDVDFVCIQPVDMPAVRTLTLKALLDKARGQTEGDGVRPVFEGAPGFPLVVTRAAAERLRASTTPNLQAALATLHLLPVPTKDPGVVVRISSAETFTRLFGEAPRLAPPPKRRVRKESA